MHQRQNLWETGPTTGSAREAPSRLCQLDGAFWGGPRPGGPRSICRPLGPRRPAIFRALVHEMGEHQHAPRLDRCPVGAVIRAV